MKQSQYPWIDLAVEICVFLDKRNPMNIRTPRNKEYWPEAKALAPILLVCNSAEDTTDAVHKIFVQYFGKPYDPGPRSRYTELGAELWVLAETVRNAHTAPLHPRIAELQKRTACGDQEAQLELGVALLNGDDTPRSMEMGHALVTTAAKAGYVVAQRVLGQMYADGVFLSSIPFAIEWLERAALQEDVDAMYRLGAVYFEVSHFQDVLKAAQWIEKAAERGHVQAQCDIAQMYLRGDGVTRDQDKAIHWLSRANETGAEGVAELLTRLKQQRQNTVNPGQENKTTRILASIRKLWH